MRTKGKFGSLPPALQASLVFLVSLTGYLINFTDIPQVDTAPAPYVAWSLVKTGDFDLNEHLPDLEWHLRNSDVVRRGRSGRWISKYPPGSAISAVPHYLLYSLFADRNPRLGSMMREGKRCAATFCALAATLFFIIAVRLFPSGPSLLFTLLFAFGTSVWSTASQSLWAHGPAVFWICCALFTLLVREKTPPGRRGLLAGLTLGLSVLCRPAGIILPVTLIVWLSIRREYKLSAGIFGGLIIPVAFLALYNHRLAGSLIAGGYGAEIKEWTGPLLTGLAGLTLAPSRGLFFYSPAFVVSLYGFVRFFRVSSGLDSSRRNVLLGAAISSFLTVFVYAKWHSWAGGWSYGPRLLTEIAPVACLWFGVAYTFLLTPRAKRLAAVLVFLSVLIHFIGVFGDEQEWHARHYLGPGSRDLFHFRDNQISSGFFFLVEKGLRLVPAAPKPVTTPTPAHVLDFIR